MRAAAWGLDSGDWKMLAPSMSSPGFCMLGNFSFRLITIKRKTLLVFTIDPTYMVT